MSLSLTCHHCNTVLTADTEDDLAALGAAHAQEHGHTVPMNDQKILVRIRRHNAAQPKPPTGEPNVRRTSGA